MHWLVVTVGNRSPSAWKADGTTTIGGRRARPGGRTPTPAHRTTTCRRRHPRTRDQIAVFVVAALAAIVLWFVIRRARVGPRDARGGRPRRSAGGPAGRTRPRTSARVDHDDDPRGPRRRPDRAALPAPRIVFTLRRARFARRRRARWAAVDPDRVRGRAAARASRTSSRGTATTSSRVAEQPQRPSGRRCRSVVIVLLLFSVATGQRHRGVGRRRRPPPDHRDGLPARRKRLPWAIFTIALITFSRCGSSSAGSTCSARLRADTYDQTVIAHGLVIAIIFLSFVVVTGIGGMVSLAQATLRHRRRVRGRLGAEPRLGGRLPGRREPTARSTSSGRSSVPTWPRRRSARSLPPR